MNSDINRYPLPRDEIKFPYALPSNLNNINNYKYTDRHIHNTRSKEPVQTQLHTFNDRLFQNHSNINVSMNNPVDTRREQYDINKHNDELYYYSINGNKNNFFDNKPVSTRITLNKQQSGVDYSLLPTKQLNIPRNNI